MTVSTVARVERQRNPGGVPIAAPAPGFRWRSTRVPPTRPRHGQLPPALRGPPRSPATTLACVLKGRSMTLACGDRVRVATARTGGGVIEEGPLPRTTKSSTAPTRPWKQKLIAANVTQVVGVVAPDLGLDEAAHQSLDHRRRSRRMPSRARRQQARQAGLRRAAPASRAVRGAGLSGGVALRA